MESRTSTATRKVSALDWLGPGACAGIALAAARWSILFGMDHLVRGHGLAITRWRIAERVPSSLSWALTTGLLCAWILQSADASVRARRISVLVCAALMMAVLTGWPYDDAYHVPGFGTSRGALILGALAVAALAGSLILRWIVMSHPVKGRKVVVVLSLVVAAALPVIAELSELRPGPAMTVRTVVRDLVVEPEVWSVESSDPAVHVSAGAITPDSDFHLDAGEMPALILSPPGRASFPVRASYVVPSDAGALRLVGAAGCDLSVAERCTEAHLAPRLTFRVEVDGRAVLEHQRTPWKGEPPKEREWKHIGGAEGVAVAAGSRITLSMEIERPPGSSLDPVAAGFGGLALVRTRERERTRATSSQPNIVLIVIDTLRADRTSVCGYTRPTSPSLERLAARGLTFDDATSASSWTFPSTASILTGLDPAEHGVVSDTACYLPEAVTTLAEALQDAGWTTAAFSGNPLVAPSRNFDQGFETFDVSPSAFLTSDRIVPDAIAWLESRASVRFFLYLHLVDPHEIHRIQDPERARFAGPPPAGMDEHAMSNYAQRLLDGEPPEQVVPPAHLRWLESGYDAAVATADRWVGRVLDRLDELNLGDTTLVAITSDHGEEFLEHGQLKHGQSLYTELVRVPLVIAGPGIDRGRRVSGPVENLDLASSLARAAGVRFGPDDADDLLHPAALVPHARFTSTEYGWWRGKQDTALRGIRADGWSLHYRRIDGEPDPARALDDGRVMLFELRADAEEKHDVALRERARALALVAEIERRESVLFARRPRSVLAGRGTLQLLQATGYAGQGR